jgi:hypothetical protein
MTPSAMTQLQIAGIVDAIVWDERASRHRPDTDYAVPWLRSPS